MSSLCTFDVYVHWRLQVFNESSSAICRYKPQQPIPGKEPGICATNLAYFSQATGLTREMIDDPTMQYLLRFRIPRICTSATVGGTEGQLCAEWVEDQSLKPWGPRSKTSVADICYSLTNMTQPIYLRGVGCAFSYPLNKGSADEFAANKLCENKVGELAKKKCFDAVFEKFLGWNITVLETFLDLIRLNGHDCQTRFLGNEARFQGSPALVCETGQPPNATIHPVLTTIASLKGFRATPDKPLKARLRLPPPVKPPTPPPPSPPVVAAPRAPNQVAPFSALNNYGVLCQPTLFLTSVCVALAALFVW